MQASLIDQGLNLMLYGMGTVFVFLTILVFATGAMSKLVARFAPAEVDQAAPALATSENQTTLPPKQIMQAIKLAIAEHTKA